MTAAGEELVARFNQRMGELYETARQMAPFLAVRILPTLGPEDGLPMARSLLKAANASEAFCELVAGGCSTLTVEHLVLQHPWSQLFTVQELNVARVRLGIEPEVVEVPLGEVEARFEERMRRLYETAKRDLHYDARHFIAMVEREGGVAAARAILARPELAGGLAEYTAAGKRDVSVEALVLDEQFARLFTPEEIETARGRAAP